MSPGYTLTGLLVGFLIGLTGMGGGALMTPLLIMLLGVPPVIAVGSDLAYAAVTKAVGAAQHCRQRTVHTGLVWRLAAGSVPGSLAGVACLHGLQSRPGELAPQLLTRLLGLMLILVALALVWHSNPRSRRWQGRMRAEGRAPLAGTVAAGAVLGFLVGVTSVGSGTLFGVLLLVVFGLPAREMVGTDVYHAAILSAAAAVAHGWAGNVDCRLVAHLLLGSIPGVLLGSRLSARIPEATLRPILVGVLLCSGLKLM